MTTTQPLPAGHIITPACRLSFPVLDKPRVAPNATEAKFGCMLLIPPEANLRLFVDAIQAVAVEKFGGEADKVLRAIPADKKPLKKVEGSDWAKGLPNEGAGWSMLRCSTKHRPGLVDVRARPAQPEQFYAGCWVYAHIHAFGYTKGAKGVSWGLSNLQFVKDDTRFAGGRPATDVFQALSAEENIGGADAADDFGGLLG